MERTWPALQEAVPEICQWVHEKARQAGFTEREAERWVLAVEEVTINIVHYAYGDDVTGTITVEGLPCASSLTVRISDTGRPFDLLAAPDPKLDAALAEREIGGLGIYLARQVMDRIHYERADGKNILTLTKRLSAPR